MAQSFDLPTWGVGDPLTTYQEWNFFSRTSSGPDVGVFNPNGTPSFSQAGGFFTGGGNIYSFNGPYSASVVIPNYNLGPGYNTTLVFQIEKSLGPDEALTAAPSIGGVFANSVETIFEGIVDGFLGPATLGVYKHTFELPGNASSYTVTIPSSIHSSLQAIRVDTQAVVVIPETGSIVLAGAGLLVGLIGFVSRRAPRRNSTCS
jgi:hypothetical protein